MVKIKFRVHNYMEDIISAIMERLKKQKSEICCCPRCFMDASAIVLNQVKPQYIKRETDLESLTPDQYSSLENKVLAACETVKANPHHDDDFDPEKIFVENLSERLVEQILTELIEEKHDLNIDPDMLSVVSALVLNQVKPRYAVTDRGGAYMRLAELEHQFYPTTMAIIYDVLNQLEDLE